MEHWKEIECTPTGGVGIGVNVLLTIENVALFHGAKDILICERGTISLSSHALLYRPPASKIIWSLDLKLITTLRREPRGYLTSGGKILIELKTQGNSQAKPNKIITWQCQVCEDLNETNDRNVNENIQFTCQVCGSVQRGSLNTVEIDDNNPTVAEAGNWTCEVCEESHPNTLKHCSSCGFNRPQKKNELRPIPEKYIAKCPETPSISTYKFSFRSGGSGIFFTKLQSVRDAETKSQKDLKEAASQKSPLIIGISGLLKRQEELNLATNASLSSAFSDLDALMLSAAEMVKIAAKISSKLAKSEAAGSGELSSRDRTSFNNLIESLGIESSFEESSATVSDDDFYPSIAKNVASLVKALIQKTGTRVFTLADIYCIFNRSRTTGSLIAPADLVKATRLLSRLNLPIRLHKFTDKGILCLVPAEDIDSKHLFTIIQVLFTEKILHYQNQNQKNNHINPSFYPFITAVDLADKMKISLLLADQQLAMAEQSGKIVRDGKRKDILAFYNNIILPIHVQQTVIN